MTSTVCATQVRHSEGNIHSTRRISNQTTCRHSEENILSARRIYFNYGDPSLTLRMTCTAVAQYVRHSDGNIHSTRRISNQPTCRHSEGNNHSARRISFNINPKVLIVLLSQNVFLKKRFCDILLIRICQLHQDVLLSNILRFLPNYTLDILHGV